MISTWKDITMQKTIDEDEVLEFITQFLYHSQNDEIAGNLITQFRSGYCYHFAYMLRDTFHRGVVCWAAPFGHIVWKDIDQKVYDIEGEYHGEAFYFIPTYYLGELVRDFLHIPTDRHPHATKDQLIDIMKNYCADNCMVYNKNVERYLRL